MAISFRPSDHDKELIDRLTHTGESTTDVIRRALAALDRLEWERSAQTAAEAIMRAGEDLNDEPDAW